MATRKAPSKKKGSKKKRGRRSKNTVVVDFTDVEAGGLMPTPDGLYVAEVTSAEKEVSSSGNDMITVKWKTSLGTTLYDHFVLLPQSLFVLRTALECMGLETPDGEFEFDPDDLVGNTCGLEVQNEEYEEKDRPKVVGYLPPESVTGETDGGEEEEEEGEEEEQEEEEEEEAPPPKSKKKSKKKAASKKKKAGPLRPGARVTFEDEDGEEYQGVIEGIEDEVAVVVDDEEGEWEIPLEDLKKA